MKTFFNFGRVFRPATVVLAALTATSAFAGTIIDVGTIASSSSNNVWGKTGTTGVATVGIVDLTGAGGTLGSGQPMGPDAVKLTTGGLNSYKAQIGIKGNFGNARTFLQDLDVGYFYFKDGDVANTNLAAAPSLKLKISGLFAGELVYEPYWNGSVPLNQWQEVSIDTNTGNGVPGSGGWWWSGGLGQASSSAGPPIRSAGEWANLLNLENRFISEIKIGVGTYNINQVVYFDAVRIGDTTYNFGRPTPAVPEPTSLAIFSFVGLAAVGMRLRKKRTA